MAQQARKFEKALLQMIHWGYWLYLPPDYNPARRYPLILFLHGIGERGSDLSLVTKQGLPKRIEEGLDLPFIVVSPQCPANEMWWSFQHTLIALLNEVIPLYGADSRRVYLTGLSMGGFGVWGLAARYPDRFAALAPICGGLPPGLDADYAARQLKTTPVWAFHGALDEAVPLATGQTAVDALRAVGGNVQFTVYPDLGHDSWTTTYENQELYEWFLAHSL